MPVRWTAGSALERVFEPQLREAAKMHALGDCFHIIYSRRRRQGFGFQFSMSPGFHAGGVARGRQNQGLASPGNAVCPYVSNKVMPVAE
jgi:hypothetical protein